MKTQNPTDQHQASPTGPRHTGLRVRTDVRAGAWRCNTCVGTVDGNQLFRPTCEYCAMA